MTVGTLSLFRPQNLGQLHCRASGARPRAFARRCLVTAVALYAMSCQAASSFNERTIQVSRAPSGTSSTPASVSTNGVDVPHESYAPGPRDGVYTVYIRIAAPCFNPNDDPGECKDLDPAQSLTDRTNYGGCATGTHFETCPPAQTGGFIEQWRVSRDGNDTLMSQYFYRVQIESSTSTLSDTNTIGDMIPWASANADTPGDSYRIDRPDFAMQVSLLFQPNGDIVLDGLSTGNSGTSYQCTAPTPDCLQKCRTSPACQPSSGAGDNACVQQCARGCPTYVAGSGLRCYYGFPMAITAKRPLQP